MYSSEAPFTHALDAHYLDITWRSCMCNKCQLNQTLTGLHSGGQTCPENLQFYFMFIYFIQNNQYYSAKQAVSEFQIVVNFTDFSDISIF